MSFPLSSDGKVAVYGADLRQAIAAFEATIRQAKPCRVSTSGERIEFTSRISRQLLAWTFLDMIDSGYVDFRDVDGWVHARYRLSFVYGVLHITAIVFLMFAMLVKVMGDEGGVPIVFPAAVWLSLFGMNYLTATIRFRAALQRTLESARLQGIADRRKPKGQAG